MNDNETKSAAARGASSGVTSETKSAAAEGSRLRSGGATPRQAGVTSKLYAWLVKLGVPAVVAAAIVGAVYAALVALGVLGLPGCSASIDLLPDGAQHWEGVLALPLEKEGK